MKKTLLSGPASEPVSLAEAKAHLRLDPEATDEDALIERLIAAAGRALETDLRLVFIAQAWRAALSEWPREGKVVLPVRPVLAVDEIRAFDAEGEPAIVPAEQYEVDLEAATVTAEPGAAGFAPAAAAGGVEIDFTAGFGEPADVPAPIRQAILMLVAHWYEHRSAVAVGDAPAPVPAGVAALTAPYRRIGLC